MPESGSSSAETISALLILVTILHTLALLLTSFRLWFRYHTRRLWWDDFWAILTLLSDAVGMAVAWISNAPLDNPYTNHEALPTPALSRCAHIIAIWLSILCYTCTIWFSRISISCSVVRIVPPSRAVSLLAFFAGTTFFCMWTFMLTAKSVVCSTDKSWYDATVIQCPIPNWIALSEVSTDTLSDVILVVVPLRLLWRVKLPSNQRTMILSVFSTSILATIVSAVHTAYIIPEVTFAGPLVAQIGAAVSLIVCNLLVVVTFAYRVIKNGKDLTAGLSEKCATSSIPLTTVDLDVSASILFSQ